MPAALPPDLEEAIRTAGEAVREDPEHVLAPGYRAAIGAAMGPAPPRPLEPSKHAGHRRRSLLAIASARRVLPIWERRWPGDRSPHEALEAAERLVRGEADLDRCWETLDRVKVRTDQLLATDFAASRAGESAVLALVAALDDDFYEPHEVKPGWVDSQRGGGDEDAASAASIACAGGTVGFPGADRTKRREFWEWWLTEAVPAAYRDDTLEPLR